MIGVKKYSDMNKIEKELINNDFYDKEKSLRIISELREIFILEKHFRNELEDSESLEYEYEKPIFYYIEDSDYDYFDNLEGLKEFISMNNIPDKNNYEQWFALRSLNDDEVIYKYVITFLCNNEQLTYLIFNPNSLFHKEYKDIIDGEDEITTKQDNNTIIKLENSEELF